jgi:phage gpG-like protein
VSLILIRDGISRDLQARAAAAADRRPLLAAMGEAVKSLASQAFTDPAKRPEAWAPRADTEPHPLLQKSTLLRKSIRVISLSNSQVTIGSDRPYAAAQQFGTADIPARPYLPFHQSGQMTGLGRQQVERALKAALRSRGL